MRRWNSFSELIYFPLEVLYISTIILGITGLILGQNFQVYFTINQAYIQSMLDMLRYLSSFIVQYFPLLFLLRAVYRRSEDGMVVVAALLAYISFHVGIMFFAPTNLPAEVYSTVLGIQANASLLATKTSGTLIPLHTGLIGALIVLYITRTIAKRLKKRTPYSIFSFVDKNVAIVVNSIVYSLLSGVVVAFIWPSFIDFLLSIFVFLSKDLSNPVNLFIYGIINRILSILNFNQWMNQIFWFTNLGGSWIDPLGAVHAGDVSMWTGQLVRNISGFTSGKLITPLYILNIFAIPAFILAAFQTYTDKLVNRRLIPFVIFAVIASILFGTLLPIEIFLIFTAPLLFAFHLFFTALLYAVLPLLEVTIGYSFSGNVLVATPGSLVDLLVLIRNPIYQRSLVIILFIGLMTFLLYYAVTSYYYRKGAISIVNSNEKEIVLSELLDSVGGIENIRLANSSIGKVIIQVYKREIVDFSKIHHRANKIVDTRAGFAISYGASSYMIYSAILKLKESSEIQESA